jgi:hypothetical protein
VVMDAVEGEDIGSQSSIPQSELPQSEVVLSAKAAKGDAVSLQGVAGRSGYKVRTGYSRPNGGCTHMHSA